MSRQKEYTTEKGTVLPLLNLRGKPYLQIAHRFIWLDEKYANYTIESDFIAITDDYAVCKATVTLLNEDGSVIRKASAFKREDKSNFSDFVEKSNTSAVGRALAMLGIGTQFCTQDMEEGVRLADAPIEPAKKPTSSFSRKKKEVEPKKSDGWA